MFNLCVREHERIAIAPKREAGERVLTQQEADSLMSVCERERIPALVGGYKSVKFDSFCGVIQAAGISVEILPKIADNDAFDRGVLLRMIALASDFPLARLDAQHIALQSQTLLRTLVRWFCDELFTQFHPGLLREYVNQADDLAAIRGRWRPDVDACRFPGRKDRMSCEFDELTTDNRYNQALKAALHCVQPLAHGSASLSRDVSALLGWLQDVSDLPVTAEQVRRLPSNRLTARYSRALRLAEWFLGAQAPDTRRGRSNGIALLFDMNDLFQSFLAAALRRTLPDGLRLREEGPRHFLTVGSDGNSRFQMKPDLCVLSGDQVIAVIDAKWKRLKPDNSKLGIQQADIYQMHAYAHAYRCAQVALWYPGHEGLNGGSGSPAFDFIVQSSAKSGARLHIHWIDLSVNLQSSTSWLNAIKDQIETGLRRMGITSDGTVELVSPAHLVFAGDERPAAFASG